MVWLHVISDGVIAFSYYCIPVGLVYLVRRRRDFPFNWIFWMFTAFILGCGTTHLMEVWNVWHAAYPLAGIIKAITAAASLATAAMLLPLIPKAIALPSPAHLAAVNQELKLQVAERERAERKIRAMNAELEQRVRERTADLRKANEALRESEERTASVIASAMDAIISVDEQQRILVFNTAAEEMFGCPAKEALGSPLEQFIPERYRASHAGHHHHYSEQGTTRRVMGKLGVLTALHRDGTEFPVEISISQAGSRGKKIFTAIVRDVTERIRAEAAVRESEDRLQKVMENMAEGLVLSDLDGQLLYWNPAALEMHGFGSAEDLRRLLTDLTNIFELSTQEGEVIPVDQWPLARIYRGDHLRDCQLRVRRLDADWERVFSYSGATFLDSAGKRVAFVTVTDITEHKRAEESLRDSEERLRLFIERAPAALAMFDSEMRYLQASRRWRADYGLGDRELLGVSHYVIFPEVSDRWKEIHRRGLAGEILREESDRFERADGSVQWIRWEIRPWYEMKGAIGGIVIFAEDITASKQSEEALRQSEERFQAMANGIPQLAWMAEADGSIFWYNQRWYEYTGTTFEQMQGWAWQSVHDPAVLPKVLEKWKASISIGQPFDMEFPLRGADGRFRVFLTRIVPVKDPEGRVARWFGTNTDISEREEAKQRLRELASILDLAQVMIRDLEGRVVHWNSGAQQLYGYSREEAQGRIAQELLKTVFPGPAEEIEKAMREDGRWEGELLQCRKDGTEIVVASLWVLHRDEQGHPSRILEVSTDITELRRSREQLAAQADELSLQANELIRSQQELQSQTRMFKLVLDSIGEGLVAADERGQFLLWNPAAEKILGRGPAALSPEQWSPHYQAYLPDGMTPYPTEQNPLVRAMQGETCDAEMVIRNPRLPENVWIAVNARPLRDENGTIQGGVAAFRDITQAKAAEREIRKLNEGLERRVIERTAELEAANHELESFSYSVSHDLRAPLRHISGFSKILMEDHGADLHPDVQHCVQNIENGARNMGVLIEELLNLARVGRQAVQRQPTDLDALVLDVIDILKPETQERHIEWKVARLPRVDCDPTLIKQVFQNLISNALKYSRPRPLTVIEIGTATHSGEQAIVVRDNGVGFDMKSADKLFGVFQRLHKGSDFEGTGVGLATVQRIIQKHGGRIWAEGERDRGATFYFTLGVCLTEETTAAPNT